MRLCQSLPLVLCSCALILSLSTMSVAQTASNQMQMPRLQLLPQAHAHAPTLIQKPLSRNMLITAGLSSSAVFPDLANFISGVEENVRIGGIGLGDFKNDGTLQMAIPIVSSGVSGPGLIDIVGSSINNGVDSGGITPIFVTQGDLNGDGKLDLIVINQCSFSTCTGGVVSALLGNGDGTFQPAQNYTTSQVPAALATGDFNGDGKLDVALAEGSTVQILLGNGNGTFTTGPAYTVTMGANSIAAGDLNADGKIDLVVAGGSTTGIGVLLGNGNGTFQSPQSYATGGTPQSVAIGDFNRDGRPDLLVTNQSNIAVLLGPYPYLGQPVISPFSASVISVGDLNGDGITDLVDISSSNTIDVLIGNGDGSFHFQESYNPGIGADGGNIAYVDWVSVGDFNSDGKADIAVLLELTTESDPDILFDTPTVSFLLGNGNGTFTGAPSSPKNGLPVYAMVARDFNGDGTLDLATASGSTIGFFSGHGDGTFTQPRTSSVTGMTASFITSGDFNRDHKCDLAIAGGTSMGVMLGNGDGTFQAVQTYSLGSLSAIAILTKDFNSDGNLDLAIATRTEVLIFLGNGDGTFRSAQLYATGGQSTAAMAVGDFNNDGKPDLAFANGEGTVTVILGNGDGSFQAPKVFTLSLAGTVFPITIRVADFNVDGKADVVVGQAWFGVGGSSPPQIAVLYGNGDGTFGSENDAGSNPLSDSISALGVADFNGDGVPDYYAVFGVLGNLNSDNTFYNAAGDVIAVGDFNGDAKPDIALTSGYASDIAVIINTTPNFRYTTSTRLNSSANPIHYNQAITLTATIAHVGPGTPTGPVTFSDGSNPLGTVPLVGNQATLTILALSIGTHSLSALYAGDSNFLPSTSAPISETVRQAATTVGLASNLNPSYVNQSVTFNATVKGAYGGTPTGSVIFKQGTTTLATVPLVNATASYTRAFARGGTWPITAAYSGDANFKPSTSPPVKQVVNRYPTTTTIASNLNPSTYGQAVTLTATVLSGGPTPTGSVTFKNSATTIGTANLSGGMAQLTKRNLPAGTDSVTATYGGSSLSGPSTSSPLNQLVHPATTSTTITSSLNPSALGQAVTFTATVKSPTAPVTGTVTFTSGSTTLGTIALSNAKASVTTSTLPHGSAVVTATFSGGSNFVGSSASLIQAVN